MNNRKRKQDYPAWSPFRAKIFGKAAIRMKFNRNRNRFHEGMMFYGQYTGYIRLRCNKEYIRESTIIDVIKYARRRERYYLK